MPTFVDYYEYSKLANAAYVDLGSLNFNNLNGKLIFRSDSVAAEMNIAERLPAALAEQTFVSSEDNSKNPWIISARGFHGNDAEGFAATLFEKSDGSKKVLAIRGTEPECNLFEDLIKADIGQIGFLGLAMGQAVSMINYIRLLQGGTNEDVQQLEWNYSATKPQGACIDIGGGRGYIYFSEAETKKGLGLIAPGEKINVTGHSLGGHLAALASRLFPSLIEDYYTYNAPGFDPSSANVSVVLVALLNPKLAALITATGGTALKLTDEFVTLAGNWLPVPPANSFSQDSIYNLESEDIAPGNDRSIVASVITGAQNLPPETFIPTERNSHMIEPFMDSLSLQAVLYRMKPDITIAQIENLFRAASNNDGDVLEKLVTALRDTINGKGDPITQIADAAEGLFDFWIGTGDIEARREYYDVFVNLEKAVKANPNLKLEILTDKLPDVLANLAQNNAEGLAYRYALKELNPFVVIGADYSGHNTNGRLDFYNQNTGSGVLTEAWIQDRVAMLNELIDRNIANDDTHAARFGGKAVFYRDVASDISLRNGKIWTSDSDREHVIFGDDNSRTITGNNKNDRLYGGSGNDTLVGGKGNDYLEGGKGFDTYMLFTGDGHDMIFDLGGSG